MLLRMLRGIPGFLPLSIASPMVSAVGLHGLGDLSNRRFSPQGRIGCEALCIVGHEKTPLVSCRRVRNIQCAEFRLVPVRA